MEEGLKPYAQKSLSSGDMLYLESVGGLNDEDVLKLVAEEEHVDLDLHHPPESLAQRARSRRKTMEYLDVFSPDQAESRIRDLYKASEVFEREIEKRHLSPVDNPAVGTGQE